MAIADLQALGYTEYEARVYVALLAHPGVSGYELARHSGVPRAKVYEVLEGLAAKGAALSAEVDGRRLFRPLPYRVLLARHRAEGEARLARLERELAPAGAGGADLDCYTLTDAAAVTARLWAQLEGAQRHLFVSLWAEEAANLGPPLEAARARGVEVYLVGFGAGSDLQFSGIRVHRHTRVLRETELREQHGRWLVVTADGHELTLAQFGPRGVRALCSQNQLVVLLASEWIAHDIFILRVGERFATAPRPPLAQTEQEELNRMWQAAFAF